jgi:hypothetical protein
MTIWDQYYTVNTELKKAFLCIPPYACINKSLINNLFELQQKCENQEMVGQVKASVNSPFQRVYQIEYRYKNCAIFESYLPLVEYAEYDAANGNWMCAYLAFLITVEAVIRAWYNEKPDISFKGMKRTHELYKSIKVYPDDREIITETLIDYLQYILEDILYIRFDDYKKLGYNDTFNRNLTLHFLEGVINIEEGLKNLTRVRLVLDVIAELYLMQDPESLWNIIFFADWKSNPDFNLRWQLYINLASDSVNLNDTQLLYDSFIDDNLSPSQKKYWVDILKHYNSKFK